MQACPYDAIYIDPREGTAAKCHFCAHRLEVDLAPACVAVCPEQAIKVVDLDTLLLLKTRAGGVQDMLDVAQLVWRNPSRLSLARELAGRYGVGNKLESCLMDRRERQKFVDGLPRERRRRALDELARLLDTTER